MNVAARVLRGALAFFATRPDKPMLGDASLIRRLYERKRWSVFLSLVIGYSFFYICRLTFAVTKKVMIDDGSLDANQMGKIGSAFFITYAIGRFTNGFLADRANISRFMSTGLLCSACIILLLGFNEYYLIFLALWCIHGWVQSMGSAPSGTSLAQWFSNRERGTRYGLWSAAHSIGEGLSFAVTATVVAYFGWRVGFWGTGAVAVVVALVMYRTLGDRPQTYGLPSVADYNDDHAGGDAGAGAPATSEVSVRHAQLEVLRNPYVWILGLASMAMYVVRYGVNSWGMLYLQEAKQYPLVAAGLVLFCTSMSETVGCVACGFISDKFFNAKRNVTTLAYGIVMIVGLGLFWSAPTTYRGPLDGAAAEHLKAGAVSAPLARMLADFGIELTDEARLAVAGSEDAPSWVVQQPVLGLALSRYRITAAEGKIQVFRTYDLAQLAGAACYGFGLGGLLAFLGGLTAMDICSKKASGAAMGFIGLFSYAGASIQERVSGHLIESGKIVTNGHISHDFTYTIAFWFCAACVCLGLACLTWNAKPKD